MPAETDKTALELPHAGPLTGAEVVHVVQGGNSRQTTLDDIIGLAPDAVLPGYIIPISMVGTATAGEVLSPHAVGRAFTIPANFGGGALEVLKGANPAATADVIIEKSTDSGATWSTVGTISISTSGTVTATTVAGAAIAFSKGHGFRTKAPASADATFANWAFTIIGAG